MFPGEGVTDGQHHQPSGHLPAVQRNVRLVGRVEVTNPTPGQSNDGRVADVFAHGDYAYLNAFYAPTCENTGVHVIDISDPAHPFEVTEAFIPTSPGNYLGEGIQVVDMENEFFHGDLLIHQNETCPLGPFPEDPARSGGISLWDVSDPTDPQPVTLHTGDFTNPDGGLDEGPNTNHSMFAWFSEIDQRWYVVLVDHEESTDVDILDITDPYNPVLVNDTLDLAELFGVDQPEPVNLQSIFSHDMYVLQVGDRYVMNMSYWDGGYVLLDVTDVNNVSLIAETDFALLDEEQLARGREVPPEGNAHQSDLSPDGNYLIATDEDFNPFFFDGTIDSGPHAGATYRAAVADGVPLTGDTAFSGAPTFVGLACGTPPPGSVPPGSVIALIERGVCTFQEKLDNITAAGYSAGIVFNAIRSDCMGTVGMSAAGETPFIFVNRQAGLQLLNQELSDEVCEQPAPDLGSPTAETTADAVFDRWGYVRMFGVDIPADGEGAIHQIDTYAVPEAQDPAYASGFGDLSIHEVDFDPDVRLAYLSYYSAGFRVCAYGPWGLKEVGAYIDPDGNNFWGVEVWHDENGEKYVLASDRDFGLYIFQFTLRASPLSP
ncbi:MAG: PA domain-containing protein [Acidimicrobiales bacterium]